MNKIIHVISLFALLGTLPIAPLSLLAQCDTEEINISVAIVADNYPDETSWEVTTADGTVIADGDVSGDEFCAPLNACLTFTIFDDYGDGICCGYGNGSYTLSVDGTVIASGGEFGSVESTEFNCPSGGACSNPVLLTEEDVQVATFNNYWFSFTPEATGEYHLNACGNGCDVSIWVYDYCSGLTWDNTDLNAIYFTPPNCGSLGSNLNANFAMGQTYYIRLGSIDDSCIDTETMQIVTSYAGEASGCTDPNACNYDPLATISDPEACLYFPAPECLEGATTVTIDSTILVENVVAIDLQVPWEILYGPDDHLWVTERVGRVQRIEPITGNQNIILDIQDEVTATGEPGMLGMALHPDFETTPLVYLVYNYTSGFSTRERLVSYEWNGSELINESILLNDIPGGGIHNGSRLLISYDGKILMTTGDRGNADLSQDMESLNGKLLRINLDGSIPSDNPMPDSYIYSWGHRNAQGLTYGPNGQLYSTEHGAQQSDEFNIIEENRNYGWPTVQGACNTSTEIAFCEAFNVREPLAEWSPCPAVNDIAYYNHPAIPEFANSMLMAVLGGLSGGAERISQLQLSEDGTEVVNENQYFTNYGRLRDICVNPHTGAIYFATNGGSYPGSGPNQIIEYRNYAYMMPQDTTGVGVNDNLIGEQQLNVYPNPAKAQVLVELTQSFVGSTLQLYSFNGQLMVEKPITGTQVGIPLHNVPAGAYFVKASSDKGTITKKLIIQ